MKKMISVIVAVVIMWTASAFTAVDKDAHGVTMCTVTFLDFDGNIWKQISVAANSKIDYSKLNTDDLHRYKGIYTEQIFSCWDITPESVRVNTTIRALPITATIRLESNPSRMHYFNKKGNVDIDGLEVYVTVETKYSKMSGGKAQILTKSETLNITETCEARPNKLDKVFEKSDISEVKIYPINSNRPITSYKVYCHEHHGDVNGNGKTDAVDASSILKMYTQLNSGTDFKIDDETMFVADVDLDGKITARDASLVLKYYTLASADLKPDWEDTIVRYWWSC